MRAMIAMSMSALMVVPPPVVAEPATQEIKPPSSETRCDLGGWTAPMDEKPIAVHAAPRADARVIGTLPTAFPTEDGYAVDFSIIGSRDGWLKISEATDAKNEALARPVFGGVGWIRGAAARLGIQSGRGYARPDAHSRRVLDLKGSWLTERGWIVAIAGCSGRWVLVDYRMYAKDGEVDRQPAKAYRAWFRGACAVAETTCDMPSVDRDPDPAEASRRKDR
jgi:hypothetical protein